MFQFQLSLALTIQRFKRKVIIISYYVGDPVCMTGSATLGLSKMIFIGKPGQGLVGNFFKDVWPHWLEIKVTKQLWVDPWLLDVEI